MWFKLDDGWWRHRKTRRMLRSHPEKRRDAAAAGLWALAGDWCADNGTDGWVPEDELEQWDDNWHELAKRIVAADYWTPEEVEGEPGYRFHDWPIYQPQAAELAAKRAANAERQRKWRERHRDVADGKYVSNALRNDARNAAPSRPDPTRPEVLVAGQVSHLTLVRANGKKITIDEKHVAKIKQLTGGTDSHVISTAQLILDRASGTVRNPGAYIVAAINEDPAPYKQRKRAARPSESCSSHPGEWADACRGCAIDARLGD